MASEHRSILRRDGISGNQNSRIPTSFINVSWKMYKCTALFGLELQAKKLKRHAQSLCASLEAMKHKGHAMSSTGVALEEFNDLTAKFQQFDAPGSQSGVYLTVYQNEQVILKLALNPSTTTSESKKTPSEAKLFPLMLVKGSTKLADMVLEWFRDSFSCTISPFPLNSQQLCWIVTEWCCPPDIATAGRPVQLTFSVEMQDKAIETIDVSFTSDTILTLREQCDKDLSHNPNAFLEKIIQMCSQDTHLNLNYFPLERVATYSCMADRSGRIKFLPVQDEERFEHQFIFTYLTELAQISPF